VRKNLSTPPHAFDGTVIDSVNAVTNHITLAKISDNQADLPDGLTRAMKFYKERPEIVISTEAEKSRI
jgi:hypothetical protein